MSKEQLATGIAEVKARIKALEAERAAERAAAAQEAEEREAAEGEAAVLKLDEDMAKMRADIEEVKAKLRALGVEIDDVPEVAVKKRKGKGAAPGSKKRKRGRPAKEDEAYGVRKKKTRR
ncbi:hypothetical protein LTR37_018470 [Vermiconidia calcicola]|uniref:Uncharacterized protein n=1 Tax=Vermiconidia calcicola TaxID=1690605 RepID=A0ACC3MH90_9PEZI|nr:hypothetical protein LTR37_018470 [Vermiconidia calcicola]